MSKEVYLSAIENGIAGMHKASSEVTIVHHNDALPQPPYCRWLYHEPTL